MEITKNAIVSATKIKSCILDLPNEFCAEPLELDQHGRIEPVLIPAEIRRPLRNKQLTCANVKFDRILHKSGVSSS